MSTTSLSDSKKRMMQHREVMTDEEVAAAQANPHGSLGFPEQPLTEQEELSRFPNRWTRIRFV